MTGGGGLHTQRNDVDGGRRRCDRDCLHQFGDEDVRTDVCEASQSSIEAAQTGDQRTRAVVSSRKYRGNAAFSGQGLEIGGDSRPRLSRMGSFAVPLPQRLVSTIRYVSSMPSIKYFFLLICSICDGNCMWILRIWSVDFANR